MATCHRRAYKGELDGEPGWHVEGQGAMADADIAERHQGRIHCWLCGDALLVGGGVESREELERKAEALDKLEALAGWKHLTITKGAAPDGTRVLSAHENLPGGRYRAAAGDTFLALAEALPEEE